MKLCRSVFRKIFFILSIILFSSFFSFCSNTKNVTDRNGEKSGNTSSIRVCTYNIEYLNKNNIENSWDNRKSNVVDLIKRYDFDIIGIQEPYLSQLNYIMGNLPDYEWYGNTIAGNPEIDNRHFNFIIYKKDRFEILDSGIFWLSPNPETANEKGWDAYSVRMCVWAYFKDKRTNKEFYHFNLHFDHKGVTARKESAKLIVSKVKEIAGEKPVFLTGDFNTRENSEPYNTIINSEVLTDAFLNAREKVNDEWKSFNGYKYSEAAPEKPARIDHIFVSPNTVKVNFWQLCNDTYNKKYPSDHCPIFIDCSL